MLNGIGLIAGLFIAPLALLMLGHRFRSLPARRRRLFWGATIGYLTGVVVATAAMMLPPVLWTDSAALRAAMVFCGMPAGFAIGLVLAAFTVGRAAGRENANFDDA